jgi:hypothetical protein
MDIRNTEKGGGCKPTKDEKNMLCVLGTLGVLDFAHKKQR